LIGSDDLLACFIAGNSFTWDDWFRVETENAHLMEVNAPVLFCTLSNFFLYKIQQVVDNLLNLSIFVYLGLTMVGSHLVLIETETQFNFNSLGHFSMTLLSKLQLGD
jgi:NhaP-type Na+/H+ or K+/H+ antiporter